jgi:hypothetical protein
MAHSEVTDFAKAQCIGAEAFFARDPDGSRRGIINCVGPLGSAASPGDFPEELAPRNAGCAPSVDEALAARMAVARPR